MIVKVSCIKNGFCCFYKVLNLNKNADAAQIKRRFNELAKMHHPDHSQTEDTQFIKIKKAYDTLRDPYKRNLYDFESVHGSRQQRRKNYYYYADTQTQTGQSQKYSKTKMFYLANKLCIFTLILYFLNIYLKPLTEHQLRRQNIILANQNIQSGPSAQQKRRKIYAQEMKQKKITSKVIELPKIKNTPQTVKQKNERLNSIQSIQGIKKESKPTEQIPNQLYM